MNHLIDLQTKWYQLVSSSHCLDSRLPFQQQFRTFREALALSFVGLQYQEHYLQLALNPLGLASNLSVHDLPLDRFKSRDILSIKIIAGRRTKTKNVVLSCSGRHNPVIFGCASACEKIVEVGSSDLVFPVHTTDPVTPLLYISTNKSSLEAIAKSSFMKQVKQERLSDKIPQAHHFHLSPKFWLAVVILVVSFHVIVIKMIYNECRKDRPGKRSRSLLVN